MRYFKMENANVKKMKEVILNEMIKYKSSHEHERTFYGIRTDYNFYNEGDRVRNSYDCYWDNEEDTMLDGTCATGCFPTWYDEDDLDDIETAINIHKKNGYEGKYIYLICGNDYDYGDDEGEVILKNAVVVSVLKINCD